MLSIDSVWQFVAGLRCEMHCSDPVLCQMRRKNIGVPEAKRV